MEQKKALGLMAVNRFMTVSALVREFIEAQIELEAEGLIEDEEEEEPKNRKRRKYHD
jgi:hypothetical protein